MWVNGTRVLNMYQQIIPFISNHIKSYKSQTMKASIQEVSRPWLLIVFNITHMLMGIQFETFLMWPRKIVYQTEYMIKIKNVGDIEIIEWTVKERAWGVSNTLPFTKLSGHITVKLVYLIFWLNKFPYSCSVAQNITLKSFFPGRP